MLNSYKSSTSLPLVNHPQRLKHLQSFREKYYGKEQEFFFTCETIKPECLWSPKPSKCPKRACVDENSPTTTGGNIKILGKATANPPLV